MSTVPHAQELFRFGTLRAAASAEHYALHLAALEWSLDSPITIRDESEIQSRRKWSDLGLEPYQHQIQNLITFCRRAPVALFADDVGLGKTISAGLVLSELMARRRVSRALVVAPKILLPQWEEELDKKFGIDARAETGARFVNAVEGRTPVLITTYDTFRNQVARIRAASFGMVILDEAHKLRNLHSPNQAPPALAVAIQQALGDRVFKYVLMLTATPIQNRLWDLYSLIDLLTTAKGHVNPLGSPSAFSTTYLDDPMGMTLREERQAAFRQHLSNYMVRTRRRDAQLLFPTRTVQTEEVAATEVESRLLALVGKLFRTHHLNGFAQSSIGQALMSSPQALAAQLEEMERNGTVPQSASNAVNALVSSMGPSSKLVGLMTLLAGLKQASPLTWRAVVFTSRTTTQTVIARHLQAHGIAHGLIAGGHPKENQRTIADFKADPPRVHVVVSTDAGAEGINLQSSNVLLNYDLPWNPMVLEQRIGRIHRLQSKHKAVTILNLVLKGSVEERVVARLQAKLLAISQSLGEIDGILGAMGADDDSKESFESMIRRLVVESLKGADVEREAQLRAASIDEARKTLEEHEQTVNDSPNRPARPRHHAVSALDGC